ncbi:DNA (cytosine-5-)-methyltransferase [Helicobacter pylori GAM270ASi]|uniref:site-specific DNA-methyltransferase n=1 Tax=Helicobacter pylori TaxID=210 RepID=UPI0002BAA285|nr:site-specific DNA-methyltransferase [Helicobacter pylori]EMH30567.1 DNA (cytosine-5-)-methyltransferase [Helicobacter pylori GAM270ASi]
MQNKEMDQEKSVNEKNLEVFNRYFPGCLSIENDNQLTLDTKKLKALLGDFSEIKEEGYGLDFVGKKIALNQAFKKNHKILKPLNESTSKHILIKGDNLDALKILKQSYSEKIKMIYIDPPYNTKKENFIYGDDFSQSNEEVLKTLDYSKEKLDYIKNLFGSKCHSGWLSFMYPRLLLARDLLKQDGVIFISIDDNEAAQLKLLCDEIFGEGNFVACIIAESAPAGTQSSNFIAQQHSYCLVYGKYTNENSFIKLKLTDEQLNKKYTQEDEYGKFYAERLWKRGIGGRKEDVPSLHFPVYYDEKNNKIYIDEEIKSNNNLIKIIPYQVAGVLGRWTWSKEKMIKERHKLIVKKVNGEWKLHKKQYKQDEMGKLPNSIIKSEFARTELGSLELKEIMGEKVFDYPKSTKFIKYLLQISTTPNSDDIILDFFAGSGTTAHAVLESNKSDYQKLSEGGGLFNGLNAAFKERRFILVQLDEKIDPKKNKSVHDFCLNTLNSTSPSIFDITEERIKRAGAKIKEACPNLDVGFRVFEIIDDETHANDKNLSQANQKDLFAYSNLDKMETQTILIKLLGCEGLELTTPIICLIENALYLAQNTAFIVGDIEMSEVLENLKDKGVEKISMYMPAISNDRLCLELGSNLFDLKLESGDLKIRG